MAVILFLTIVLCCFLTYWLPFVAQGKASLAIIAFFSLYFVGMLLHNAASCMPTINCQEPSDLAAPFGVLFVLAPIFMFFVGLTVRAFILLAPNWAERFKGVSTKVFFGSGILILVYVLRVFAN